MRKKICIALIAAFTALLGISVYFLYDGYRQADEQARLYDGLAQTVEQTGGDGDEAAEDIPSDETMDLLPEYAALYLQNPDLAGWIQIDDTNINYPVMYTPNNPDYYLKHSFDKAYSDYGCPYIQENCDVQTPGDNIIIYGHHMKNGSMFANLEKFKNESFWEGHRTINFNTLTERHEYEIVAVFKTFVYTDDPAAFPYYRFVNAETAAEFDEYIAKCKELALYDTGVTAEYGDKLITLSTCEYSRSNGRLVVVAKRA